MAKIQQLNAAKRRIERWCGLGVCSESAIEAVILIDLFHDALGFSKVSTSSQSALSNGCIPDIVLSPKPKIKIVVEVKKPNELDGKVDKANTVKYLKQAADYVCCLNQEFGMLTDGMNWICFRVESVNGYHEIHQLLRFNMKSQSLLGRDVFLCSTKASLQHFFFILKKMRESIDGNDFDSLTSKSSSERFNYFVQAVRDTEIEEHDQPATWAKMTSDERRVVKTLCYGSNLNRLIEPILKPIHLSEEDRKKNKEKQKENFTAS